MHVFDSQLTLFSSVQVFLQKTYALITVAIPTQANFDNHLPISPKQLIGPFTYCADVGFSAQEPTLYDPLCKLLFRFNALSHLIGEMLT